MDENFFMVRMAGASSAGTAAILLKTPPSAFGTGGGADLFAEMLMVENVVLTEAVIPGAAGAVAKLKVWIVPVSPAADGAFVVIELLLLLAADAL